MIPLVLNIKQLLACRKEEFIKYLTEYIESYELPIGESQIRAWKNCYDFLIESFKKLDNKFYDINVIFEYMLPLEKYRRPDVIILFEDNVTILEFKDKNQVLIEDIEQTIGYREDIKNYHKVTGKLDLEVRSFLVLTKGNDVHDDVRNIKILNKDNFNESVFRGYKGLSDIDTQKWINSKYEPIPSIIEAAHKLFFEGDLPDIKNIADGEIHNTVSKVKDIVRENEVKDKNKKIVFVSGVPGAGKTLVALKVLYEYNKEKYEENHLPFEAVYLSGNGPLVSVLRYGLSNSSINGVEGKTYIKGMLEYKKDFLYKKNNIPNNTVLLFDEAQRAWDKEQMRKDYSEAEGLLQIGENIYSKRGYVTIICFIGDGQSIYRGEEKGIDLWREALNKYNDWEIYLPPKYAEMFDDAPNKKICEHLYLDTSIRSNFIDTSNWIESFLDLDYDICCEETRKVQNKGLVLRVTRDMDKAIGFVKKVSSKNPKYKYGLFISSKFQKTKEIKEEAIKYTKGYFKGNNISKSEVGAWFNGECVNLKKAASEFDCQGLELDFPVVIFGGDYYIKNNKWVIRPSVEKNHINDYEDIEVIIANVYRVLLSRARKGMIIFIPDQRGFDETFSYLRKMGIEEI